MMSHPSSQSGDTQPISQSVYDSILRKSDATAADAQHGAILLDVEYSEVGTTQKTLNEGDTGHVDLFGGLHDSPMVNQNNSDGDNEGHDPDDIVASSPTRYEPFPESQRFVNHTPAPASSKANQTSTSKSASHNPLHPEKETPSAVMGLSQLFNATQAPSSPMTRQPRPDFSSDMPSPNIPIQRHHATAAMTSPLQMTSSVKRPRSGEPQTEYVSLKESQAAREKLVRSTISDPPDNATSDDGFDEDTMLQRRVRKRLVGEEVGRQFAIVTAPARAGVTGRTRHAESISPSIGRQHPNEEENAPTKNFQVDSPRNGTPIEGGYAHDSEVETEQEDEGAGHRNPSSQQLPASGDEDKENFESGPVEVLGTAVRVHDALSQALAVEGSPTARKGPLAGVMTSTDGRLLSEILPQTGGEDTRNDITVINSQTGPLGSLGHTDGPDFQRKKAISATSDMALPNRSAPSASPEPIIRSSPPPRPLHPGVESEHAHPDFQRRESDANTGPSGLPACLEQDVSGSLQPSNKLQDNEETAPGEDWEPSRKNMDNDSSRFPRTYQIPRRHTRPESDHPRTIPETSPPDRRVFVKSVDRGLLSAGKEPISPNAGDGLPPVPRQNTKEHRTHLHPEDVPRRNMSDPVSAIFSSPSGRQRRSMTEIATVKSPRPAGPEVRLEELGIFNTVEDRAFQTLVAGPERPPASKRRKTNDSRSIRSSVRRYRPTSSNLSTAGGRPGDPRQGGVDQHEDDKQNEKKRRPTEQEDDNPRDATDQQRQPSEGRSEVTSKHQVAQAVVIKTPSSSSPVQAKVGNNDGLDVPQSDQDVVAAKEQRPQSPAGGSMAANRVLAFFNGRPQGYFPATCVGISRATDGRHHLIEFEDSGPPDVIELHNIKRLELRVDDLVKVDYQGLPKKPFVVVGFADKLKSTAASLNGDGEPTTMTDIYGHKSLVVKPRQPENLPRRRRAGTVTVPMSCIYFDKALWSRLGNRPFTYHPQESEVTASTRTPLDGDRTPGAFASRTSRIASETEGLFSNMAFALSGKDKQKLHQMESLITHNGGRVLQKGFNELFEIPFTTFATHTTDDDTAANAMSTYETAMKLNSKDNHTGFVCLIADECSRTYKYLQALALNLPCLASRWVRDCIFKNRVVDWELYLLAAGQSKFLDDATRSRTLPHYPPATARLSETVDARPKLLADQSVILVLDRGKTAKEREPYASLICMLGPSRICHVRDFETAADILKDNKSHSCDQGWDLVYVGDDNSAATARQSLSNLSQASLSKTGSGRGRGRPRKYPLPTVAGVGTDDIVINGRKVKILDNEVLCQSLIVGRMLSWGDF